MTERQEKSVKVAEILKNKEEYDISNDRMAISVLNRVLRSGNTVEIYIGKYGIVIREVKRTLKYDQSPR